MLKPRHGVAALATSLGIIGALGVGTASAAPTTPAKYTIQAGDTLGGIASRFGTTIPALASANGISNPNVIFAGATLVIPGPGQAVAEASAAPEAAPAAAAPAPVAASHASLSGVWACIANLESGSNPSANTGNGYYGMFQFSLPSWQAAGGTGNPANASAAQQLAVAQRLQAMSGWGNWPVTSRECGV